MKNVVVGYTCSAIVFRPAQKDWVVSLQHQQGAPFNLICSKGQAARFTVGRVYDFTLHPENFIPQPRQVTSPKAEAAASSEAPQ